MNYRMIFRVLGLILLATALLLLLPLVAGLFYRERVTNFLLTIAIAAAAGGLLMLPKPHSHTLVARDGFVIVGLGWILLSLLGAHAPTALAADEAADEEVTAASDIETDDTVALETPA